MDRRMNKRMKVNDQKMNKKRKKLEKKESRKYTLPSHKMEAYGKSQVWYTPLKSVHWILWFSFLACFMRKPRWHTWDYWEFVVSLSISFDYNFTFSLVQNSFRMMLFRAFYPLCSIMEIVHRCIATFDTHFDRTHNFPNYKMCMWKIRNRIAFVVRLFFIFFFFPFRLLFSSFAFRFAWEQKHFNTMLFIIAIFYYKTHSHARSQIELFWFWIESHWNRVFQSKIPLI